MMHQAGPTAFHTLPSRPKPEQAYVPGNRLRREPPSMRCYTVTKNIAATSETLDKGSLGYLRHLSRLLLFFTSASALVCYCERLGERGPARAASYHGYVLLYKLTV